MRKGKLVFEAFMKPKPRESLGGARTVVQRSSETALQANTPMLAARIYAAPSMQIADVADARYPGKENTVENIYHPTAIPESKPIRSGLAQTMNWLLTGRME